MKTPTTYSLLQETFQEFKEDDVLQHGAALAYYMSLSLAPLLVTMLALGGLFFSPDAVREGVVTQLEQLVGAQPAETVDAVLRNANQPTLGKITATAGFVMLLFGAAGVFAQLQKSLNQIWNVELQRGTGFMHIVKVRITAVGLVLTIGLLLIVSLVATAAIATMIRYFDEWLPAGGWLASAANFLVSYLMIALFFGVIFKVLPDVRISWQGVWVGAFITAGLFTIGQMFIGFYLGQTSTGSPYGAAGSLLVLLSWVYYSAQIFFLGAEFTQVWARHFDAEISPDRHAQWSSNERRSGRSGGTLPRGRSELPATQSTF